MGKIPQLTWKRAHNICATHISSRRKEEEKEKGGEKRRRKGKGKGESTGI